MKYLDDFFTIETDFLMNKSQYNKKKKAHQGNAPKYTGGFTIETDF